LLERTRRIRLCFDSGVIGSSPLSATLEMNRRKKKMAAQAGEFMRQYQRKAQGGKNEPNDRQYSRKFEGKLKRMKPEELDELLHGEESESAELSVTKKPEREIRWEGR
jgi:hypothetical protein